MAKNQSNSVQSKTAGQGAKAENYGGARGSRGGDRFDEPEASGSGVQTPFRGQEEGVLSGRGGGNGGGGWSHLQMEDPKSGDPGKPSSTGPLPRPLGDEERVGMHATASTSPRCGFQWLESYLAKELDNWRQDELEQSDWGFGENGLHYRYKDVASSRLPHIIGRGGRMLRKIEHFSGAFVFILDHGDNVAQVVFAGPPRACLWAKFCVSMIEEGNFSIMESLASHGF